MPTVRAVGILRAQPPVGRVLVYHGIHAPGGYAEEQAGPTKLLEITEVAMPVGLWNYGYAQPHGLKRAPDDGHSERRMVNVCVA